MNKKIAASFSFGLVAMAVSVIAIPAVSYASTLNRQLDMEMTGSDVSALQSFLARDITIYPQGLVTGYFGFLTKAAVSNFQKRNGIDAVGRVGPITLRALNLQMDGGGYVDMGSGSKAPIISSVGVNIGRTNATLSWTTDEDARGTVFYSTAPLNLTEHINSVDVNGNSAMTDSNFRSSQNVSLQNLQENTTYYYMVYTTDQSGNVSVTWPSTFKTTN